MLLKERSLILYKQLYHELNQFGIGEKFWGIRHLESHFQSSRRVIDFTLKQLVRDGLLEHRKKEGFFVLKYRKNRHIMFFYNDWINGELPQIARYLEHEFEQLNEHYQFDSYAYDYQKDLVPLLIKSSADIQIICLPARSITQKELIYAMTSQTPVIFLERNLLDTPVHCTFSRIELGMSMLVEFLIQNGHSSIAILPAEPLVDGNRIAAESFCGFAELRGCRVVKIPCCAQSGNHSPTLAYDALMCYLEKHPLDFSVLFVIGEYAAGGALNALKEYEIQVPEVVSVVATGFSLSADRLHPSLTTVGINPRIYSEKLVHEIHRHWEHFKGGARITLSLTPEIIKRESVCNLKQTRRWKNHSV